MESRGRVLSREQILAWLHGPDAESFDRSIDMLISRLRLDVVSAKVDPAAWARLAAEHRADLIVRTEAATFAFDDQGADRDPDRARGHHSGFGLGLDLCRRIVALHGGSIELAATAEGGTRARVVLPR